MALQSLTRRQLLKIVSDSECRKCFGSGLRVTSEHSGTFSNTIKIEVVVCSCVSVVRQMKKQPPIAGPPIEEGK